MMFTKLTAIAAAISIAFIANTAFAQAPEPPTPPAPPGGADGITTLSSLPCVSNEVPRLNALGDWVCSAAVTANDAAAAAAQTTADNALAIGNNALNEAQNAQQIGFDALNEAQNAQQIGNDALVAAQAVQQISNDAFVAAQAAEQIANDAFNEAQNAQQIGNDALNEAQNAQQIGNDALAIGGDAQNRVGILEGLNLDGRVTNLEDNAAQFERIIIVSPVGGTALGNGFELINAVAEAAAAAPAASASDPILIFVEPGVYDIAPGTVNLPNHVSLRGAGEGLTRILGRASPSSNVNVVIARTNALISDLSIEFIGPFGNGILVAGQDVTIRHAAILGPGTNAANNGIGANPGTNVKMESLSIEGFNVAVRVNNAEATMTNLNSLGNTNGVFVLNGGKVEVWDSILQVLNTGSGAGLLATATGTEATVWNSQIGNLISQIFAFTRAYGSRIRVLRTQQTGGSGFVEVASSQISVVNFSTASQATCVFSYNLALVALDGNCQ